MIRYRAERDDKGVKFLCRSCKKGILEESHIYGNNFHNGVSNFYVCSSCGMVVFDEIVYDEELKTYFARNGGDLISNVDTKLRPLSVKGLSIENLP
jgi:hypothetical protein